MVRRESKIKGVLAKIKADLQDDVIPCMNAKCNTGGFFSVPLILFSFIEYLGVLWKNPVEKERKSKKKKYFYSCSHFEDAAVPFIKKYLSRVRPEYKKYGGLLYGLYRHSLVHHYHPSVIILNRKERVSWAIIKNSKKGHLTITKKKYPESNGKLINHTILAINLEIFFLDLLKSIDEFEGDALKYSTVGNRILKADKKLNYPRPEYSLPSYVKVDLNNI